MNKKIYFVYKYNFRVIEDYLNSLNIFHGYIEIADIDKYINSYDIFIFGQLWLDKQSDLFYKQNNMFFLNVEHLTEQTRMDHIVTHIKNNLPILDYSWSNILLLKEYIKINKIVYTSPILLLPYQFNSLETHILKNTTNEYEYDVGIINATIKKDVSVNNNIIYKRNLIWDKLQDKKWKSINILGWGRDRDLIIKKCKIIINVHLFDVYNIFEHIRCDRLLFANKLVISDKCLFQDSLDIKDYVIWEDYDTILETTEAVLDKFDVLSVNKDVIPLINNRKNILQTSLTKILNTTYRENC